MRVVDGEVPDLGTVLRTGSGRLYQVIGVRGRALRVLVLPRDTDLAGEIVWDWYWAPRKKRTRRLVA